MGNISDTVSSPSWHVGSFYYGTDGSRQWRRTRTRLRHRTGDPFVIELTGLIHTKGGGVLSFTTEPEDLTITWDHGFDFSTGHRVSLSRNQWVSSMVWGGWGCLPDWLLQSMYYGGSLDHGTGSSRRHVGSRLDCTMGLRVSLSRHLLDSVG